MDLLFRVINKEYCTTWSFAFICRPFPRPPNTYYCPPLTNLRPLYQPLSTLRCSLHPNHSTNLCIGLKMRENSAGMSRSRMDKKLSFSRARFRSKASAMWREIHFATGECARCWCFVCVYDQRLITKYYLLYRHQWRKLGIQWRNYFYLSHREGIMAWFFR